jgi:hypothetical protein
MDRTVRIAAKKNTTTISRKKTRLFVVAEIGGI